MRFGGIEAIVLLIIVLLVFGAAKLPGLAKSAGESVKIFKKAASDGDASGEASNEEKETQNA